VPYPSALSECPIRVPYPSALSECPIRVPYPSALSECPIRVPYPSALSDSRRSSSTTCSSVDRLQGLTMYRVYVAGYMTRLRALTAWFGW
jgi:hypothetical protein